MFWLYTTKSSSGAGFSNCTEYSHYLAEKSGFLDFKEYQVSCLRNNGFVSKTDYQRFLAMRKDYREGYFIEEDFFELRAEELGLRGVEEYYECFDELVAEVDNDLFLKRESCQNAKFSHDVRRSYDQRVFENGIEFVPCDVLVSVVDNYDACDFSDEEISVTFGLIDELSEDKKRLIEGHYLKGMSYEDLAKTMGVGSRQAVKIRDRWLMRGLARKVEEKIASGELE